MFGNIWIITHGKQETYAATQDTSIGEYFLHINFLHLNLVHLLLQCSQPIPDRSLIICMGGNCKYLPCIHPITTTHMKMP